MKSCITGNTVLHHACALAAQAVHVRLLSKCNSVDVNMYDWNGETPLTLLAMYGDLMALRQMLNRHVMNSNGKTTVMLVEEQFYDASHVALLTHGFI
jgi:ankyrin repeat protein